MRARKLLVAAAVCAFTTLSPAPAMAAHSCELDDTRELDTICENYHSPKPLLQYLYCLVSPFCDHTH